MLVRSSPRAARAAERRPTCDSPRWRPTQGSSAALGSGGSGKLGHPGLPEPIDRGPCVKPSPRRSRWPVLPPAGYAGPPPLPGGIAMALHGFPTLSATIACALLGCAPGGTPAGRPSAHAQRITAPTKPWDQAAVSKLAADLAQACTHLYDEWYAEQGIDPKIGSGDEDERFRLGNKLRRIEEQTMALSAALAAGQG